MSFRIYSLMIVTALLSKLTATGSDQPKEPLEFDTASVGMDKKLNDLAIKRALENLEKVRTFFFFNKSTKIIYLKIYFLPLCIFYFERYWEFKEK